MIDHSSIPSPPWSFKGYGWKFLLSPLSPSSPASVRAFADHDGTSGRLVGGSGSLCLYRYTDSPIGPYDEVSYSPGSYEYLNRSGRSPAKANRITTSYVSCGERGIFAIRRNWGIPAEQAKFTWLSSMTGRTSVIITLPTGAHIIELLIQQTSFPIFTINSKSMMSDYLDAGKLFPIVQPLLD